MGLPTDAGGSNLGSKQSKGRDIASSLVDKQPYRFFNLSRVLDMSGMGGSYSGTVNGGPSNSNNHHGAAGQASLQKVRQAEHNKFH